MEIDKKTYTVKEAAKAIGISVPKLYQLCHDQSFPCVKIGTRIVIPIDKLDNWLNEKCSEMSKS